MSTLPHSPAPQPFFPHSKPGPLESQNRALEGSSFCTPCPGGNIQTQRGSQEPSRVESVAELELEPRPLASGSRVFSSSILVTPLHLSRVSRTTAEGRVRAWAAGVIWRKRHLLLIPTNGPQGLAGLCTSVDSLCVIFVGDLGRGNCSAVASIRKQTLGTGWFLSQATRVPRPEVPSPQQRKFPQPLTLLPGQ